MTYNITFVEKAKAKAPHITTYSYRAFGSKLAEVKKELAPLYIQVQKENPGVQFSHSFIETADGYESFDGEIYG